MGRVRDPDTKDHTVWGSMTGNVQTAGPGEGSGFTEAGGGGGLLKATVSFAEERVLRGDGCPNTGLSV